MIEHQCLEKRNISKTKRSICSWCNGGVEEERAGNVSIVCGAVTPAGALSSIPAQSALSHSTDGCCAARGIVPKGHFSETGKRGNVCRKSMQKPPKNIKMRYKSKIVEKWCLFLCPYSFLSFFYPKNRRISYFEPELPCLCLSKLTNIFFYFQHIHS